MAHKWNIGTPTAQEEKIAQTLAEHAGLMPVIARILVRRGIRSTQELSKFLSPKLSDLYDPFLMDGMEIAVNRLNRAIGHKEKILIYGDYDVDGTTAVALVYTYLRRMTTSIDYYIPDRYDEGSGISFKGIDYACEKGCTLIIALDCGIKSYDKVEYARKRGIDFIICDHHVPDDILPEAVAILNPKVPGSRYPFSELCGCGVGFKFMQAFALSNGTSMRALYDLLDLVAVSIVADIVPIVDENRILALYGLRNLNQNPAIGLKGIIDVSGIKSKELDSSDIIFKIGPRINASGRMQSGRESVDLLLARSMMEAKAMSHHINEYNNKRRELDRKITREANSIVESYSDIEDRKVIIVYDPTWHKGVIGIVASRLSEKYNRPTIVLSDASGEFVCGSVRSIEGVDMYTLIESCKEILENFGGHPYAVGLTLRKEQLHEFIQQVSAKAEHLVAATAFQPRYDVDAEISFDEISPMLRRQIRRLAPFGPGNEKPIFLTRGVVCMTPPRILGRSKKHLKMLLSLPDRSPFLPAFGYNLSQYFSPISRGVPFDVIYTIEEQTRMGKKMVQLLIVDIHFPPETTGIETAQPQG